jgi:hypothetical protein
MVQILPRPESKAQTFAKMISGGLSGAARGAETISNAFGQRAENKALADKFGDEFKNIRDPELKKLMLSEKLKSRSGAEEFSRESAFKREMEQIKFENEKALLGLQLDAKTKEELKNASAEVQEKIAPFISGLETIERMEEIGKQGNLGFQFGLGSLSGQTRQDRAEYEQLGKSLISLMSPIVIRNRIEFEILADKLFDPHETDASRKGTLDAAKRIITQNLQQYTGSPKGEKNIPLKEFFK